MAVQHIRQQLHQNKRAPSVHVWHMHQVNYQLGCDRLTTFPNIPILASKINFKSASSNVISMQQRQCKPARNLLRLILLIMLRLSFGRKPCLFVGGVISETICNLANAILHYDSWDPNNLSAPNQHLVPE
jgi:hypothetical protein